MEYTEDADRRELLLHSAYDSDTVRAMERPLLDKSVMPLPVPWPRATAT